MIMSDLSEVEVPPLTELVLRLKGLEKSSDAVARCVNACASGRFFHPDGRVDELGDIVFSEQQLALMAYLSAECPKPLSVEIGFGMGSTSTIMLASRREAGKTFEHLIFDPYGIETGQGAIVEDYLRSEFGDDFRRVMEPSQLGLANLVRERGRGIAGLVFIDGSHHFEDVLVDFFFADALLCIGGHIVFDDAWYPAIESVVRYVFSNRKDYTMSFGKIPNTVIAKKVDLDRRIWSDFQPFAIPDRSNWTSGDIVMSREDVSR